MQQPRKSNRKDNRIILHFDYDCFYASVFEHENPALKSLPLAVQQKHIIVTCNYEARRRGLRKLQLITEARKTCPDVIIMLGEELGKFRDASKALYKFLESYTWNGKVERLGFDEVFMDVTDVVDYNETLLNQNDLSNSFFQLKRDDPTNGFAFDATSIVPNLHPPQGTQPQLSPLGMSDPASTLLIRLGLGAAFATHLRFRLEEEKGYTSTAGISTNKLLSKLVGKVHKPQAQTTLLPPYDSEDDSVESNVTSFIDGHEIGKIPGIGSKTSRKIRNYVLSRPANFDTGLMYEPRKDTVSVYDARKFPGMGPEALETILGGPGAERGIGGKIWDLLNGIDDTEVQQMKKVPSQISIEDSYTRLDNMGQVLKELHMLATSLIKRMHTDLLEDDDDPDAEGSQRWIAHPKTVRLSTRARLPLNEDGVRLRNFARISRSTPMPNFVLSLKDSVDAVVEKLVYTTLIPLFRQLHPPQSAWNLSLMNICVTNLVETASDNGGGEGRDISKMFKRQETVLKEWQVEDRDVPPGPLSIEEQHGEIYAEPSAGHDAEDQVNTGSEDMMFSSQNTIEGNGQWEDYEEDAECSERCIKCGATLPAFAMAAHERFHSLEE